MDALFVQLQEASLDLIVLVIAITIHLLLALAVYRSNPRSATNIIFVLLTVCTVCWLVAAHVARVPGPLEGSLMMHRLAIFFAAPMSLFFFLLAHTFPSDEIRLRSAYFYAALGGALLMMVLNISPYAFVATEVINGDSRLIPGPGLIPFSVLSTFFSAFAVYLLIKKYLSAVDLPRKQLRLILDGMLVMLVLIIATILVPILVFNSLAFVPLAPLYTLAFLGATAYAITKYHLFNIKVLLAQALTITICVVLFAKLFGDKSQGAFIVDGLILAFTVIFGYLLVQSVKREVEQRELIQKQEQELEVVNKQQENLLHFISHEIKGYLTKSEAGFAGIVEGDYGTISEQLTGMAKGALADVRKGVRMVMEILDASNLKKGTVGYKMRPFDLRAAVIDTVAHLKPTAEEKHIGIKTTIDTKAAFILNGDEEKIRQHVLRNLIDNAIRYTPSGDIEVTLTDGDKLRFSVKDSGVGITPEDMKMLFTEGGHGKDSMKVNVHSTGYGLFIAKQIVEAHKGKIWAESEGEGKGSRFVIEFPTP